MALSRQSFVAFTVDKQELIISKWLGFIEFRFDALFVIQNFAHFEIFMWIVAATCLALNIGLVVLLVLIIIEFYLLMILFEKLKGRTIAIDPIGLICIIGHDRVCIVRIIRVTFFDMMGHA